ncbi:hypothetical protein NLJ89_g8422 [Agrocybe chaxingu]|uniref:Uncharacterized protein n=1 Tax=Agrocybe chaxingu TaxID=84603 RepID=A0A9W8MSS2_9AGAR|nr:hypothetical protein NLJ89_g8422 [Agrocybe chaxingu]
MAVDEAKTSALAVGLSNPKLSQGRRQMLDLVNKLHSTGVQVDIDLPQIAVIGSQSAGKSSLIESISGITLPRAAGTCTRCPIECRLSHSNTQWHCTVSLRFTTGHDGQALGQARNQVFGDIIYDKSQVEDRIRRAQKAILNPKISANAFLNGNEEMERTSGRQLTFSTNCVSLQISGPDVADLSFCDLPGLIASVSSSGGKNDITLVENLVTSYIRKPSCIILLTVACETDFENQGAHRLAEQYDPEGKRTIGGGVLTKPDRIPIGEESNWLPFIRNEKETLENNWFCVKQPSSNDLKTSMTWAQARQKEDQFFASTSPWCELDGMYQKYLRTSNLVERLSLVLSDLISKRLPGIYNELETQVQTARNALQSLPREPPSDPQTEVTNLLHAFVVDLARHVEGVPNQEGLLQCVRPAQEKFKRAIRETAPNFRPFESEYEGVRHIRRATFLENEEAALDGEVSDTGENENEDEDEDLDMPEPGQPARQAEVDDSSSSGDDSDDEDSDEDEDTPRAQKAKEKEQRTKDEAQRKKKARQTVPTPPQPAQLPRGIKRKEAPRTNYRIYIDEVLQQAHLARTRELPGHYPFVVQKTFIEGIIRRWQEPALALSATIHKTVYDHVNELISKHFGHFGQGQLEQRIRTIMHEHIQTCASNAQLRIEWLLDIESEPFSLNTHYLQDYKEKFLAFYKGERRRYERSKTTAATPAVRDVALEVQRTGRSRDKEAPVVPMSQPVMSVETVLAGLAQLGYTGLKEEDLQRLIPGDRMEPALDIMADVRAYFQVAYKRFADNVPLAIDRELIRGVERNVLATLYEHLQINKSKGRRLCREMSQESQQTSDRRADLKRKLERLEIAYHELRAIGF